MHFECTGPLDISRRLPYINRTLAVLLNSLSSAARNCSRFCLVSYSFNFAFTSANGRWPAGA